MFRLDFINSHYVRIVFRKLITRRVFSLLALLRIHLLSLSLSHRVSQTYTPIVTKQASMIFDHKTNNPVRVRKNNNFFLFIFVRLSAASLMLLMLLLFAIVTHVDVVDRYTERKSEEREFCVTCSTNFMMFFGHQLVNHFIS